jgi:hypothetical protein
MFRDTTDLGKFIKEATELKALVEKELGIQPPPPFYPE